jgi:hypothetical protein
MPNKGRNSRATSTHEVVDIEAVYRAFSSGRPRAAAYMMWKWASMVALGVTVLYVVAHFVVKYW